MTEEDIVKRAKEDADRLVRAYENGFKAGAAAEREACAKVCQQMSWPGRSEASLWKSEAAEECAAAIRARSLTQEKTDDTY